MPIKTTDLREHSEDDREKATAGRWGLDSGDFTNVTLAYDDDQEIDANKSKRRQTCGNIVRMTGRRPQLGDGALTVVTYNYSSITGAIKGPLGAGTHL